MNGRVKIASNPLQTAEDNHYKDKPYYILFYPRKAAKNLEWKLGITAAQKAVLELFAEDDRELDGELLINPLVKALDDGKGFLAEMLRRKVLISPS